MGATEAGSGGGAAPLPCPVITESGYSDLCAQCCVTMWFLGAGAGYASPYDLYREAHGQDYSAPGIPSTFTDLYVSVQAAGKLLGRAVRLFGKDGCSYDLGTTDQLVRDQWCVIAGVAIRYLVFGVDYFHFINLTGFDGQSFCIADALNHQLTRAAIGNVHLAMINNWTGQWGADALAFKIGA